MPRVGLTRKAQKKNKSARSLKKLISIWVVKLRVTDLIKVMKALIKARNIGNWKLF